MTINLVVSKEGIGEISFEKEKGTFLAFTYNKEKRIIEIDVIEVKKELRRTGIGSRMLKELERFAKDKKVLTIIGGSTPTREAISFWLKMGYQPDTVEDYEYTKKVLKEKDPKKAVDIPSKLIEFKKEFRYKR